MTSLILSPDMSTSDVAPRLVTVTDLTDRSMVKHASESGLVLLADGRVVTLHCWEIEGVSRGGANTASVRLSSGAVLRVTKDEVMSLVNPSDVVLERGAA